MSPKGLKITEAGALPVSLLGAGELCVATRHCLKNTRLLTSRGRILATLFSFRAIKTVLYMSNCQAFQRGPFALSNNILELFLQNFIGHGLVKEAKQQRKEFVLQFVYGQFLVRPGPVPAEQGR